MDAKEMMKKNLAEFQAKKAEIDKKCAPLIKERERLWEKAHAIKASIDGLTAQEKKNKSDYREICAEISRISIALGGKSFRDNQG